MMLFVLSKAITFSQDKVEPLLALPCFSFINIQILEKLANEARNSRADEALRSIESKQISLATAL